MIKKLFNFYVKLYVSEDTKNQKPRIEIKRVSFLTINIIFMSSFCISTFTGIVNILGNLLGILK